MNFDKLSPLHQKKEHVNIEPINNFLMHYFFHLGESDLGSAAGERILAQVAKGVILSALRDHP